MLAYDELVESSGGYIYGAIREAALHASLVFRSLGYMWGTGDGGQRIPSFSKIFDKLEGMVEETYTEFAFSHTDAERYYRSTGRLRVEWCGRDAPMLSIFLEIGEFES